jgi:hypothetical protein
MFIPFLEDFAEARGVDFDVLLGTGSGELTFYGVGSRVAYLQLAQIPLQHTEPFLDGAPLDVIPRRALRRVWETPRGSSPAFREERFEPERELRFLLQVERVDLDGGYKSRLPCNWMNDAHLFELPLDLEKERSLVRLELCAPPQVLPARRREYRRSVCIVWNGGLGFGAEDRGEGGWGGAVGREGGYYLFEKLVVEVVGCPTRDLLGLDVLAKLCADHAGTVCDEQRKGGLGGRTC